MEKSDKKIIQNNIGNTGNRDKIHGAFGISHSTENGTDHIVCSNTGNSEEADCQIGDGTRDSFDRGRHDRDNRTESKTSRRIVKSTEAIINSVMVFPVVREARSFLSGADRLCNHNGRPHRQSYDHDSQHMHDLTPDGNGGDMCDRIKLSDDKQIRHSVGVCKKYENK